MILRRDIAVCVVARDEAPMIADCIVSARSLTHRVVVVDTGSQDDTVAIARDRGAEVIELGLRDAEGPSPVTAARNLALDLIDAGWVLCVDADERVIVRTDAEAFEASRTTPPFARLIRSFSERYTWANVKLVPQGHGIRFQGDLHETIAVREPSPPFGEIAIYNVRTDRDATVAATFRDLAYFESRRSEIVETTPRECYHYGRALLAAGRPAEAVPWLMRRVSQPFATSTRAHSTHTLLGTAELMLGHLDEALDHLSRADAIQPRFSETKCLIGEIHLMRGNIRDAEKCFLDALECPLYHNAYFLRQNLETHGIALRRLGLLHGLQRA